MVIRYMVTSRAAYGFREILMTADSHREYCFDSLLTTSLDISVSVEIHPATNVMQIFEKVECD